jgi:hypothetical protein
MSYVIKVLATESLFPSPNDKFISILKENDAVAWVSYVGSVSQAKHFTHRELAEQYIIDHLRPMDEIAGERVNYKVVSYTH